jgi:hypothetical protein
VWDTVDGDGANVGLVVEAVLAQQCLQLVANLLLVAGEGCAVYLVASQTQRVAP